MAKLIALVLVGLTLPIWAGALAAVIGTGFWLLASHPIPFLLIGGGILLCAVINS